MRLLVFQYRMVSYEYFMDKLQWYELSNLVEGIPYLDRNGWEQTRAELYTLTSMFAKEKMKPIDVMRFAWEGEVPEEKNTITNEDLSRLKEQAKNYLKHERLSN